MKKRIFFLALVTVLSFTSVFAADDDLPPTDDPPVAPIDDWVPALVLVGLVYFGHKVLKGQAAVKTER